MFFILLLVGAFIFYKLKFTPSAKLVKRLSVGKTPEQAKVIEYFVLQENIFNKHMTDQEYLSMIRARRDALNLKQKAIGKTGLDEDQISEIPPVMFEGFVYKGAFAKRNSSGLWVSSAYQVTWLFFSSEQVYFYSYTFHMDEDKRSEKTDEYFYQDVTSFSTTSESEQAQVGDKSFSVDTNKFSMIVPGDKVTVSMDGTDNVEQAIQAMKQKLREKKQ